MFPFLSPLIQSPAPKGLAFALEVTLGLNFQLQPGKRHRLRLINAGAEGIQHFSIDGHTLNIIASDLVPLVPYEIDIVTLGIGQRTDVMVKAMGQATDSFWMRSNIGTVYSMPFQPFVLAAID